MYREPTVDGADPRRRGVLVGGPTERGEVGGVRTDLGGALDTSLSIRKHLIHTSSVGLPSQHTIASES